MSASDVRNMAGRAGRYGFQEIGRAIILANTPFDRARLFHQYVMAPLESVRSSFDVSNASTWLLRLLRQVVRVPRADAPSLLINTFGGYVAAMQNPNFVPQLRAEVVGLVQRMLSAGLADETADGIGLTLLGIACGSSSLSFESCLRLIEAIRRLGNLQLTPQILLALLQTLHEGDEIYVPTQRKGTAEGRWRNALAAQFDPVIANELTRFAADQFVYWARCKKVLMALAWAAGVPMEQIEQTYSISLFFAVAAGDVRGNAEAARFRLRSIFDIVSTAFPTTAPGAEQMDKFLTQLEFGIPEEGLFTLALPVQLSRSECVAILQAGITSVDGLEVLTREELARLLPAELVERLRPEE